MPRTYVVQLILVLAAIFAVTITDAFGDSAVPSPASSAPTIASGTPVVTPASTLPGTTADLADAGNTLATVSAPASTPSAAPSAAPSAEPLPSEPPALSSALATAAKDVQSATGAGKLAAWLVAASSLLWVLIALARRQGRLLSRKAVLIVSFVASVVGVAGSQLLLGMSQAEAWIFAITGPGAVWLNATLRAFGVDVSKAKKS